MILKMSLILWFRYNRSSNSRYFLQKYVFPVQNFIILFREFLGRSASAIYGKKSKNTAYDVTVGTKKMKIICPNLKCHMPIWRRIYQSEKICAIFWTVILRAFRKKSKAQQHIICYIYKWCYAALWIFSPQNALGDGPAFWIYFQDSRIRVKGSTMTSILWFD